MIGKGTRPKTPKPTGTPPGMKPKTYGFCGYCGEPVDYPLPIHPKCGEIWLRGWHAREEAERNDFIKRALEDQKEKAK